MVKSSYTAFFPQKDNLTKRCNLCSVYFIFEWFLWKLKGCFELDTTILIDMRLWKTTQTCETFILSVTIACGQVLSTDQFKIYQSQQLVWHSKLFVMVADCDWWISIECFSFKSRISTKWMLAIATKPTHIVLQLLLLLFLYYN